MKRAFYQSLQALVWVAALSWSVGVVAAEPRATKPLKPGEYNPANATVDMFEAQKAGQIEVRMIPKDVAGGKVLITNKSGQPLNVKLPDAFAGVHVLPQVGAGMMGSGLGGGIGQSSGGAFGGSGGGGMGGGMGGAGGGAGVFNVAPERVGELPYVAVCLEHGKPDPRSTMKYEIRPLETVAAKSEVRETLKLLGQGAISQRTAQVLAWHYNNNMSFEELAAKQIKPLVGTPYPYFNPLEVQTALQAHGFITKKLEDAAATAENPNAPKL